MNRIKGIRPPVEQFTSWTTANRPATATASPNNGRRSFFGYNTTLAALEYWNGTVWIVLGQAPTVTRLLSGTAQTYTSPAGVVRHRVRIVAGGGGGSAQVTNVGSNGTDSTFQVNATGTAWQAVKGTGGAVNGGTIAVGGIGGATGNDGTTGTLVARFSGQQGFAGQTTASGVYGACGNGGNSVFGGAGVVNSSGTQPTAAKANTGSGGAGGLTNSANSGSGGGAGEYVEFLVTGMTTATYTVGAGGNGGAAGTVAGGNGAAGIIIVEEFFS